MSQERPTCRFCLETTNEKMNPLVEPCGCRGSLRYVHAGCLSRWRRLNPTRNANKCLLCFVSYTLAPQDALEMIPDFKSVPIFLLRFPFFLGLSTHYVGVVYYSMTPEYIRYKSVFFTQQYIFQLLYFLLFLIKFDVKNKREYLIHFMQPVTLFIGSGLVFSNLYMREMEYMSVVPITMFLGLLYMRHIHILLQMNDR